MTRDFAIIDGSALVRDGRLFQLYSCYDYAGFCIGHDRTARMSFVPHPEHGVGLVPVVLVFEDVDYLECSQGFGTRVVRTVDEMGFMSPEQTADAYLLTESQSTPADHLLFRLEDDHVRIHARRVRIEADDVVS